MSDIGGTGKNREKGKGAETEIYSVVGSRIRGISEGKAGRPDIVGWLSFWNRFCMNNEKWLYWVKGEV